LRGCAHNGHNGRARRLCGLFRAVLACHGFLQVAGLAGAGRPRTVYRASAMPGARVWANYLDGAQMGP
jgi:hypothetical protein